jgi:4-amino-4-deoxy-L-arabinose transferase-like glycosyltransferase
MNPAPRPGRENACCLSIFAVFWISFYVLVDPRGAFPLNDDFQYAACARGLLHGVVRLPSWALSSTLTHALLGAIATAPWGASDQALRFWEILVGGFGAAGVYFLARRWRASPDAALLAALTLALSPLYAAMSASFHVDVTAAALTVAALIAFLRGRERRSGRWLAASSVLIALAGLTRQTCFLCAAGGAAALARERRLGPREAAALLGPASAAAAVFFLWVRFAHGVPWAAASGAYAPRAEAAYWLRPDVWLAVAVRAFRAFETAALCLFPLAAAVSLRARRAAATRGEKVVVALVAAAAAVLWFRARGLDVLPNTFHRGGLGAVTLEGAFAKDAGWWGSPIFWNVCAAVALLSALVFIRSAFEAARGESAPELAAAALFCGLPYAAMLIMRTSYDRYLLAVLPAAAAAAVAGMRGRFWRLSPAFACVLGLGLVSSAGLQDYFAWNRARWEAGAAAVARGARAEEVDAGFDWNGPLTLERNLSLLRTRRPDAEIGIWDWRALDHYRAAVTFSPGPPREGLTPLALVPYRSVLAPYGAAVYVYGDAALASGKGGAP